MKSKHKDYCQIYNEAIDILASENISASARWLYIVLSKLEHRFTGKSVDFFFRSNKDLQNDSGLSGKTVIKAIRELKKIQLIETWQMHWKDKNTGKLSQKHITAFRILDENF